MKYPGVGIGVMILQNYRVLLGKRNEDPKKASSMLHGEGTWTMPGGKVDFGETLHESVKRELFEETGITAKDLKLISVTDEILKDVHFVTIGFLCRKFEGEPKIMEPDEIVNWGWFSLDDLPKPLYSSSEKIIKNYLEKEIYNRLIK